MAFSTLFLIVSLSALLALAVHGQLSDDKFYKPSCPNLHGIVRSTMAQALAKEGRLGASVLRLFFHDCFVNGCDGSVLLDDTPTFTGEKNAFPNRNSARGFEVIDTIKSKVEAKCGNTVSCADILALASRDGVFLLGGPHWEVRLGRRDARTASQADANINLPPPFASLQNIIDLFAAKGFNAREMTALSGGHSIGFAQCRAYRNHIYNETNIDPKFAALRQQTCPFSGGDSNLGPFDTQPNKFGNEYYKNLVARRGLLHSDQELYNGGSQDSLVELYSKKPKAFRDDFAAAMVKMGNLSPLTGVDGEIRLNCRVVN